MWRLWLSYFFFELEPEWEDPEDWPRHLSDECDLERLRFLSPDEDLERLRFCPLSGEEEGERDLFRGEEPFPDLELDLEWDLERDPDLELDELLERDLKDKKKTEPFQYFRNMKISLFVHMARQRHDVNLNPMKYLKKALLALLYSATDERLFRLTKYVCGGLEKYSRNYKDK